MVNGTVKWFNSRKGYGFISTEDAEIFVHYSNIVTAENEFKSLGEGDEVTFDIEEGKKGPEARNVTVTKKAPRQYRRRNNNNAPSDNNMEGGF